MNDIGEQRRLRRGAPSATAFLSVAGRRLAGPYLVNNLSAGGALLSGIEPLPIGTSLHLDLRLPGRRPIAIAGAVVRTQGSAGDGSVSFAVAFRDVGPDIHGVIQQAVTEALERSRAIAVPVVLALSHPPREPGALERHMETLGRRLRCASTPLDALRWLQDPHAGVEAALVGLTFGRASGFEVLTFLAAHFPEVRRVLVAPAVDTAKLERDRAFCHVHAILVEPWNREQLETALGLA
jgi:hypothetical protein